MVEACRSPATHESVLVNHDSSDRTHAGSTTSAGTERFSHGSARSEAIGRSATPWSTFRPRRFLSHLSAAA